VKLAQARQPVAASTRSPNTGSWDLSRTPFEFGPKGKLTVIDGPFTEAKEIIGGYAIVETKTREEAIEIALRFMELRRTHDPDFEYESKILPVDAA
jgi:hypothetical protein